MKSQPSWTEYFVILGFLNCSNYLASKYGLNLNDELEGLP